ncbi:Biphenyl dioxygenase subunit alpha [Roseovarius sp. THAF9]|uniref:aromatic ring-hydroxylating oxygenase subunit alpha n=1 Tax=Roseovarius sp. THAF9 TaxID=2587847 RepID=UPI00126942CD|nr:SRPBCC family protein [Roseovarius sp. THAF9]QFT94437.1 Biphenyl dioxygenase subunit alpha [Roseovarius sp. THAF9]
MTLAKSIANPIDALRANVSVPFEQARAMPPEVYKTDAFLQAEIDHIFRKEWYCVGRADALAKSGDYVTCDLADQPIIVLRDREGDLKAFSNVCRHRMSTLLHGRGHTKSIVCPYHAWTYNLDGSLRGAPAMSGNAGFCKSDYSLPRIRCEVWLGWVFITLNPEAEPVAARLAELEHMIAGYDMNNYTETFFEEHVWDTNWKVLAENFMESYHLPVCHAGTIGGLSKLEEMVCPPGYAAFNYHTILKDDSLRIAMAHPSNTRLEGDERRMTYLIAIYPSLMITLTPGYFWYLSLHPQGPSRVRIRFGGGMSNDYAGDAEAEQNLADLKALLDDVNIEDRGCTEKVYRGLCADGAEPGHLSHLERPNFDFAQYLMSRIDPGFEPRL